MLALTGLIAFLFVGLAVDTTNLIRTRGDDDEDEFPELSENSGESGPVIPSPDDDDTAFSLALEGTEGSDWLAGGDGDDSLMGWGGADDLHGGQGADTLDGGDGDDWLYGESDYGAGGDDLLLGGAGNDYMAGQGGNDILRGGPGDDTMFGGEGHDLLQGGQGTDWLSGNAGNDTLMGFGASDLSGDEGDDVLWGSADPLTIWMHGGEGDDTLFALDGDFAEGGAGSDLFVLTGDGDPNNLPTIADFNGTEDRIELRLPAQSAAASARPEPVLELERGPDDTVLLKLDGQAVGKLIAPQALRAEDVIVTRPRA